MDVSVPTDRRFPVAAGIFFGLGLGGFFDGIVLHQILQWHHLVSQPRPPVDVANIKFNVLWDGLFHASTYVFTVIGLILLWRTAHRSHLWWSGKMLLGTFLIGFGVFNLLEGMIDHQILQIHHVNELAPREQWIYWDIGFLIWGALMVTGGAALLVQGRKESPGEASGART